MCPHPLQLNSLLQLLSNTLAVVLYTDGFPVQLGITGITIDVFTVGFSSKQSGLDNLVKPEKIHFLINNMILFGLVVRIDWNTFECQIRDNKLWVCSLGFPASRPVFTYTCSCCYMYT